MSRDRRARRDRGGDRGRRARGQVARARRRRAVPRSHRAPRRRARLLPARRRRGRAAARRRRRRAPARRGAIRARSPACRWASRTSSVTEGVETTCGSKILEGFVPPYDGTVVARLRSRRAPSMLGKLNMDEFAMGSSNENCAFEPGAQPVGPDAHVRAARRAARRRRSRRRCAPARSAPTPAARSASPRRSAASSAQADLRPRLALRRHRLRLVARSGRARWRAPSRTRRALLRGDRRARSARRHLARRAGGADYRDGAASGGRARACALGVPDEYFSRRHGPRGRGRGARGRSTSSSALGATLVDVSLPHTEVRARRPTTSSHRPRRRRTSPATTASATASARRTRAALEEMYAQTRGEGFGAEVKRRIMLGTYALRAGYYDAYYLQGAEGPHAHPPTTSTQAFAAGATRSSRPTSPVPAFKLGEKLDDPLAMYLADVFTLPCNLAGLPGCRVPCGFTEGGPADRPAAPRPAARRGDAASASPRAFEREHDWHAPAARRRRASVTHAAERFPAGHRPRGARPARDASRRSSAARSAAFGAEPNSPHLIRCAWACPGALPVLNRAVVELAVRARAGARLHDPPALPLRAQALLLSGPAQGLSDLAVRPADLRGRHSSTFRLARRGARGAPDAASTWRRTRARTSTTPRGEQPGRLQPRGRAAVRDRQRAGPPLRRRGGRVPARAARRWCATSASTTATWRRARSAATPTCRCCASAATTTYGTRAELKNINSFRSCSRRSSTRSRGRSTVLDGGGQVVQETRLWDADARQSRVDAHQGGGARLPLLPRAGPAAARRRRRRAGGARAAACPSCPRTASPATPGRSGCRPRTRACW